jgi:hypothetical protein
VVVGAPVHENFSPVWFLPHSSSVYTSPATGLSTVSVPHAVPGWLHEVVVILTIEVAVSACPTTLVMVPTPAVPRPMKARPAVATAAPAMRATDRLCKMPARSLIGAP